MKIIENAKIAENEWLKLKVEDQARIKKYFHLRPTNRGITLVTTLPFMPMRSINISNAGHLNKILTGIASDYGKITQTDEIAAKNHLTSTYSFPLRKTAAIREENSQAVFINTMNEDVNLMVNLSSKKNIIFIASEFIFEQGKNRIDIIGYNQSDLYFFEFKKERTTKVDQLENYLIYYNSKLSILKDILKVYPINPVPKFNNIIGVMVMKYSENSHERLQWKALAAKHHIEILFMKESLTFYKV